MKFFFFEKINNMDMSIYKYEELLRGLNWEVSVPSSAFLILVKCERLFLHLLCRGQCRNVTVTK